jgi:hypothetical protein
VLLLQPSQLYTAALKTKHNRDPQLLSSAMYFQQFTFHRAYFFTSQRFTLLPAILYCLASFRAANAITVIVMPLCLKAAP